MLGYLLKAQYAIKTGDFPRALELVDRARNMVPQESEAAYLKLEILLKMRSAQIVSNKTVDREFITELVTFMNEYPNDYRFPKLLGVQLVNKPSLALLAELDEADVYLLRAISLLRTDEEDQDVELADSQYYMGIFYYNHGDFYEASTYLQRVVALDRDAAWALYYAGLAAEKANRLRLAHKTYTRYKEQVNRKEVVGQLPVALSIHVTAALVRPEEETTAALTAYLKEKKFSSGVIYSLVRRFHAIGAFDQGVRLLDVLPREQHFGEYFLHLGLAKTSLFRYSEWHGDLSAFLKDTKADEADGEAVSQILDAALLMGDYQETIRLSQIYAESSNGLKAAVYAAYASVLQSGDSSLWQAVLEKHGDQAAIRPLAAEVARNGLLDLARNHLIQLYMAREDWKRALKLTQEQAGAKPGSEATDNIAVLHYLSGDVETAFKIYEDLIAAHPDRADFYNNYGYFLCERNEQLEKARVMLEKAVAAESNNDAYLDSLGWVYYKLGDYTRAEAYILKALVIEPDDPEKLEHLGYIYEAQGKEHEARKSWSRSLDGAPEHYREILNKLDPP